MVDFFSLALTHVLMALAAWRLFLRDDLDRDGGVEDSEGPPEAPAGDGHIVPRIRPRLRTGRDHA